MDTEIQPLPRLVIEPLVRAGLVEDLGRAGDITSDSIVPADMTARVALVARGAGILAGLQLAALAWELVDPRTQLVAHKADAARLAPGDVIATITGPARALLTGERVALNFLSHLSGIATVTRQMVDAIGDHPARLCCTRKTMPGMRSIQKYAVRCGGGQNHRFGLDDAVLIKDNHVAAAGGITTAINRARAATGHMVKIEVEVDTLDQLGEALEAGADIVLLDNMRGETLAKAVGMSRGRALTEASGTINPQSARDVAASGVDIISAGWLTHSAPVLDIGLDWQG